MVVGAHTRKRVGRSFGGVIARSELHGSLGLFEQDGDSEGGCRKKSSIGQITFYMIKEFETADCNGVLGRGNRPRFARII